jgi:hypothetical protein
VGALHRDDVLLELTELSQRIVIKPNNATNSDGVMLFGDGARGGCVNLNNRDKWIFRATAT